MEDRSCAPHRLGRGGEGKLLLPTQSRPVGVISLAAVVGGLHPHQHWRYATGPPPIQQGPEMTISWQIWALLAAVFAALTAIFAKVGIEM